MASTTNPSISWDRFPASVRLQILESLLEDSRISRARYATVSSEWQAIAEPYTFARLTISKSCFEEFAIMTHRNSYLVRYIYVCLELEEYSPQSKFGVTEGDEEVAGAALQGLFEDLSDWEPTGEKLTLDISIYSRSDLLYCQRNLTFAPNVPVDEGYYESLLQHPLQLGPSRAADTWKLFDFIMLDLGELTAQDMMDFAEDPLLEPQYDGFCVVPAVTGLSIRRQTRREWCTKNISYLMNFLPNLGEFQYEPWRGMAEDNYRVILNSLSLNPTRRIVLFENHEGGFPRPYRTSSAQVSRALAQTSVECESIAASHIVDATPFFAACEPHFTWSNLTALALSSRFLEPKGDPIYANEMLQSAAKVALEMPKLETMEVWNGYEGVAGLFRYQAKSENLLLRGTWDLSITVATLRLWDKVTPERRRYRRFRVVQERLDPAVIKCYGDAIYHLRLSTQVMSPTSLYQARVEQDRRDRDEFGRLTRNSSNSTY